MRKELNAQILIVIKRIQEEKIYEEYVVKNICQLEEWSGYQYDKVIYDSDLDSTDGDVFRNKILNHQNLYFIIIILFICFHWIFI